MKSISFKIILTDDNRVATMENAVGFPSDQVESHLLIIGLLENLKQKHQEKLKTLYQKTVKKGEEAGGVDDC